jgi:hypothetical protein
MIRFYARAKTRGFLCSLDRHRFSPCRSPQRYQPIGSGHHVFRVKAIGYSGLRGPVTTEPFIIYPLCGPVFHSDSRRGSGKICA